MGENSQLTIDVLMEAIAAKKQRLDSLRPFPPDALGKLEHRCDLDLTYTSNALGGNTLSPEETALVIEQGATICGKPLKDHLEALDHYDAIRYARERAGQPAPLTETGVAKLHRLVVHRSRPDLAGQYASSSDEIPVLMEDFARWLGSAADTPRNAFTAHRRLVEIHPFIDGNGRTARLLMNLILLRGGYPPVSVRPEDGLAHPQGPKNVDGLLYQRLDASLDDYLTALQP